MLCKYIYSWSRYWTFQSQTNSPNHSNQQQQRCNNLQISMNPIQSNSQRGYSRSCCALILPKRIRIRTLVLFGGICGEGFLKWKIFGKSYRRYRGYLSGPGPLLCQGSSPENTNSQNSSDGVGPTLMSENFSRWNVLKHYNEQKLNS